jgi:two-component system response regulator HydG
LRFHRPTLLESELFGALKGAYTGADRDRMGVIESANRGTVLLDEIGDIELNFQFKLLRFLQEREIRPVGARAASRWMCACSPPPTATCRSWSRKASSARISGSAERGADRDSAAARPARRCAAAGPVFPEQVQRALPKSARLMESGMKALQEYTWPGNVRQLQHLIERLTILAPNGRIDAEAVQQALTAMESREEPVETLAEAEEEQIRRVLAATGGNKSRAAQILGIERKTLYRKLERMKSGRTAFSTVR